MRNDSIFLCIFASSKSKTALGEAIAAVAANITDEIRVSSKEQLHK